MHSVPVVLRQCIVHLVSAVLWLPCADAAGVDSGGGQEAGGQEPDDMFDLDDL
jgi:hypothetical protein